jgi:hypothetical protein
VTASTRTWKQIQETATHDLTVWRAEREFRKPLPSYLAARRAKKAMPSAGAR